MAKSEEAMLAEATRRILAMRQVNVSRARLAKALGVTMDVIQTIEKHSASRTHDRTQRQILEWLAQGGAPLEAPPPLAPGRRRPGRPVGSRRGRPPAALRDLAPEQPVNASVTLELEDGRTARLPAGRQYRLRGTVLYEVVN